MLGIYSNVGNILLYPSTTTNIDLGSAATSVNIGSTNGFGNTTIRNGLNVINGFYSNTGIGVFSVAASYAANAFANTLTVRNTAIVQRNFTVGLANNTNANIIVNSINENNNQGFNTGALQVRGGAGIGGNLYVGGNVQIGGNLKFTGLQLEAINNTPVGSSAPSSGNFSQLTIRDQKPARRPLFNFDFANSQRLDSTVVYTRTGPATYYDMDGNLRIAPPQTPRFTHDPSTLQVRGLMIEESRQNLQVQSAQFGNTSVWATQAASLVTATETTSPTGNYDAYKLVDDNSTGSHGFYGIELVNGGYVQPVTQNQTYTASIFAKAGARSQMAIVFAGEGAASIFDLQNGVVAQEGGSYNSSIQTLANGWFRCSSTVTKQNVSGNVLIYSAVGLSTTFTGDNTSALYVYGFQLEQGAFATSYINNRLVANVRGADQVTLVSSEFNSKYPVAGAAFAVDATLDYRPTSLVVNNQRSTLFSFSDGTVNNRISLLAENQNNPVTRTANLVIYGTNVLQTNVTIATANLQSVLASKISGFYTTGNIGYGFNGNTTSTSVTVSNIGTGISQLTIGSGPGTASLNGAIAKLQIWGGQMTLGELSATTIQ